MSSYITITPTASWSASNASFDRVLELAAEAIRPKAPDFAERILGQRSEVLGMGLGNICVHELSPDEQNTFTYGIEAAHDQLKCSEAPKRADPKAFALYIVQILVEVLHAVKIDPELTEFLREKRRELETLLGRPFEPAEAATLNAIRDPDDLPSASYLRTLFGSEREKHFREAVASAKRRQDKRESSARSRRENPGT